MNLACKRLWTLLLKCACENQTLEGYVNSTLVWVKLIGILVMAVYYPYIDSVTEEYCARKFSAKYVFFKEISKLPEQL